LKDLISIEDVSYGMVKRKKRAIIWSSGLKFAALKTKGALGSKNFERKTLTFFVNGDGSLKHKMACGKLF
jgi:hypothetical protein